MCDCGINIIPSAEALARGLDTTVPLNDVINGGTQAQFRWYACLNVDKVNEAFRVNKVEMKPGDPIQIKKVTDMDELAVMSDNKKDMQIFKKDLAKILRAIVWSQAELDNATCKTGLTI